MRPLGELSDRNREDLLELNDPVLAPLFTAGSDNERQKAIHDAVLVTAHPVITAIVRRVCRSEGTHREEEEELLSIIHLRLIAKLQATATSARDAIMDLRSYIAVIAYHTLYDLRRERFPERTRLKNRLRYVLKRDPRLALWATDAAVLCGLARDRGTAAFQRSVELRPDLITSRMRSSDRPADAVVDILTAIGAAVPFDKLVSVVANVWNIHDQPPDRDLTIQPEPIDHLRALAGREYMAAVWHEIELLPPSQRTALLLNLRDSGSSNALTLFILLGIADAPTIANMAGITPAELQDLWDRLPLDDLQIAARLGLTRQQVINLRKSARARLARRTARFR
jgi:hypothetical protein